MKVGDWVECVHNLNAHIRTGMKFRITSIQSTHDDRYGRILTWSYWLGFKCNVDESDFGDPEIRDLISSGLEPNWASKYFKILYDAKPKPITNRVP
jgi:hypothetical protein